ncbi:MAG: dipeptidase [Deltaproteobacteria bacterium]|nr:dipeptidase [Deltaproteobacteria bacterium]
MRAPAAAGRSHRRLGRAVLGALALPGTVLCLQGCARPERAEPPSAASGSAPAAVTASAAGTSIAAAGPRGGPTAGTGEPALPVPVPEPGPDAPVPVVDLHVDTAWQVHSKGRLPSLPEGHITAEALRAGHYAAVLFAIYVPDDARGGKPRPADTEAVLGTIEKILAANPSLRLASQGPAPPGAVAVYLGIEGARAFASDPAKIDGFIARGVRLVGPVHAHDNAFSSSATGSARHGLTAAGKALCRRIYEQGALVDASHMSDAAFADLVPIAEAAGAPIVASHSNARAKCRNKRNLTDDQLRAIARTGGIAGLNFHGKFIASRRATIDDLVRHALHMVGVAGIDHLAIGSDFDGATPARGLEDASRLPDLARALGAAGLSQADVRKIFSDNALRVLGWKGRGGTGR